MLERRAVARSAKYWTRVRRMVRAALAQAWSVPCTVDAWRLLEEARRTKHNCTVAAAAGKETVTDAASS
jgi:hypothetical protein